MTRLQDLHRLQGQSPWLDNLRRSWITSGELQRWIDRGVFERIWAVVQEACEDLGGCDWEWQAADTAMGKARMGGTSSARTRPTAPSPA